MRRASTVGVVDDFDGVSGDHSLLIRTLDALLDIPLRTEPGCPFATAQVPVKAWDAVCPVSGASASTSTSTAPAPAPGLLSRLYSWMWPSSSTAPETKLASVPCVGQKRMKQIEFSEVPYSNEYLPRGQVQWIRAVREARLRALASATPDSPVTLEMNEMLKTFKLWRMGHTRKAVYYEDLNLPERKPMTASGGVGGGVAQEGEGVGADDGEARGEVEGAHRRKPSKLSRRRSDQGKPREGGRTATWLAPLQTFSLVYTVYLPRTLIMLVIVALHRTFGPVTDSAEPDEATVRASFSPTRLSTL